MRPVTRGPGPRDLDGSPVVFQDYKDARPYLIDRIGDWCSSCETRQTNPAVEHIRGKNKNPTLEREWDNLLLACINCNSRKLEAVDTAADVDARVWPHLDATFRLFRYKPEGRVELAEICDATLRARAARTMATVRLDCWPGHHMDRKQLLRATDRRWELRRDAWTNAMLARDDLRRCDTPEMRRQIVRSAHECWSVWMTVFADDPQMCLDLCEAFAGTEIDRV